MASSPTGKGGAGMSFVCGQCGCDCGTERILVAHLMRAHGLASNPVTRSLGNLYEQVHALEGRVSALEGQLGCGRASPEELKELREYLAFMREERVRGAPL